MKNKACLVFLLLSVLSLNAQENDKKPVSDSQNLNDQMIELNNQEIRNFYNTLYAESKIANDKDGCEFVSTGKKSSRKPLDFRMGRMTARYSLKAQGIVDNEAEMKMRGLVASQVNNKDNTGRAQDMPYEIQVKATEIAQSATIKSKFKTGVVKAGYNMASIFSYLKGKKLNKRKVKCEEELIKVVEKDKSDKCYREVEKVLGDFSELYVGLMTNIRDNQQRQKRVQMIDNMEQLLSLKDCKKTKSFKKDCQEKFIDELKHQSGHCEETLRYAGGEENETEQANKRAVEGLEPGSEASDVRNQKREDNPDRLKESYTTSGVPSSEENEASVDHSPSEGVPDFIQNSPSDNQGETGKGGGGLRTLPPRSSFIKTIVDFFFPVAHAESKKRERKYGESGKMAIEAIAETNNEVSSDIYFQNPDSRATIYYGTQKALKGIKPTFDTVNSQYSNHNNQIYETIIQKFDKPVSRLIPANITNLGDIQQNAIANEALFKGTDFKKYETPDSQKTKPLSDSELVGIPNNLKNAAKLMSELNQAYENGEGGSARARAIEEQLYKLGPDLEKLNDKYKAEYEASKKEAGVGRTSAHDKFFKDYKGTLGKNLGKRGLTFIDLSKGSLSSPIDNKNASETLKQKFASIGNTTDSEYTTSKLIRGDRNKDLDLEHKEELFDPIDLSGLIVKVDYGDSEKAIQKELLEGNFSKTIFNGADINLDSSKDIFEIVSNRYVESALPRLAWEDPYLSKNRKIERIE